MVYEVGDKVKFKYEERILTGVIKYYSPSMDLYAIETKKNIYSVPSSYIVGKYNKVEERYKWLLKSLTESPTE